MNEDDKLLAEIAYRYYIEEMNQNDISNMYNIGRTTISRMIKRAHENNIVTIQINDVDTDIINLKNQIQNKFPIKYVEISNSESYISTSEKNDLLGKTAAFFLNRIINSKQNIGISWGQALADTINHLSDRSLSDINVIPLVGGPSQSNSEYHINALVYEFARAINGQSRFINATAIQESKSIRDGIFNSQYFDEIKKYWSKLDVAIVGIGGILSSKDSLWRDLLTESDMEFLRTSDVVGDCCCRFIDKHGKIIKGDIDKRTISIDFSDFLDIPERIGIARGSSKVSAIKTMLTNGYLTGIILDIETAKALVK